MTGYVVLDVLLASVAVERLTELLHAAKIFEWVRGPIGRLAYSGDAPVPPFSARRFSLDLRDYAAAVAGSVPQLGRGLARARWSERPGVLWRYPGCLAQITLACWSPGNLARRLALFGNLLLGCGYCLSVWAAAPFAIAFCSGPWSWAFWVLVLHGGSNLYHVLYQLIYKGRVRSLEVTIRSESDV